MKTTLRFVIFCLVFITIVTTLVAYQFYKIGYSQCQSDITREAIDDYNFYPNK